MTRVLLAIALAAAAPLAAQQTFTHSWSDTVVRGDTTRIYPVSVSSAYLTGAPAVIIKRPGTPPPIDTIVTPPPPAPGPPPAPSGRGIGIGVGAFHLPTDSLYRTPYSATTINGSASMQADLDKLLARKGTAAVAVRRSASLSSAGRLSVAAACADIRAWPELTPARGSLKVNIVSDDITGTSIWGPGAPYYAGIDSIARCSKARWPWLATAVRQKCSGLSTSYKWRWLDNCWNQYEGTQRVGTPAAYIAQQEAAGKARGLGRIYGINGLDGGDGSSRILGTYTGATDNRWQMAALEVERVSIALLPRTCILESWQASQVWSGTDPKRTAAQIAGIKAFDKRPDVRAAWTKVRAVADTLPARACYVRP